MLLVIALFSACVLVTLGIFENMISYASVEESSNTVKVFVGDILRAPANYIENRFNYIEELAANAPFESITAIIGFNDYYTVDEVENFIQNYDDIAVNRLFMWPEGETGRLSFPVDGSIEEGIAAYVNQVEETWVEDNIQFIEDHQRFLNGEYGIFAMTVTCSAVTLNEVATNSSYIYYVDVMHNAEAEEYAQERGKSVYYIDLPSKPDGAT
jgi:hypothetical protein